MTTPAPAPVRRKAGRKALPWEIRKSERVATLVTPSEKIALDAVADGLGLTLADLVRRAIDAEHPGVLTVTEPSRDLAQAS